MWYWWFDKRDNTWHAWRGITPNDGDVSACTERTFLQGECVAEGNNDSQGRCDACRRAVFQ